jgi:hypothetical protein
VIVTSSTWSLTSFLAYIWRDSMFLRPFEKIDHQNYVSDIQVAGRQSHHSPQCSPFNIDSRNGQIHVHHAPREGVQPYAIVSLPSQGQNRVKVSLMDALRGQRIVRLTIENPSDSWGRQSYKVTYIPASRIIQATSFIDYSAQGCRFSEIRYLS